MANIRNATPADAINAELCGALADLAKSVDVAARQILLRSKFESAIADAEKAERAAEALRAAAHPTETSQEEQASPMPAARTTGKLLHQDS